jgi:ABC-2 type transport system ATP-binding protein
MTSGGRAPILVAWTSSRSKHLHKRSGATVAVDDVSFTVTEGEIFGVLGPNGAGKTTTAECVSGLRVPDGGDVRVHGWDCAALRELVGVPAGAPRRR